MISFLKRKNFLITISVLIVLTTLTAVFWTINNIEITQAQSEPQPQAQDQSPAQDPAQDVEEPNESGVGRFLDLGGNFIFGIALLPVLLLIAGMFYLASYVAAGVMVIAAYMLDLFLSFNVLDNPLVHAGWSVFLNITNLGFVLAIIVIAFATIFQLQDYAIKKVLWKLIVAAILVNFSLVIAGAFINIADIIIDNFLDRLQRYRGFSNAIAGILNPQQYLEVKNEGETWAGRAVNWVEDRLDIFTLTGLLQLTLTQIIVFLLTALANILMCILAFMYLIRYVFLSVLLITSPIVWLLWIFPNTKNLWQIWWEQFLRWVFFAPISLLFFVVIIEADNAMKNVISEMDQTTESARAVEGISNILDLPEKIATAIVAFFFVVAGLIIAEKFSLYGSKMAIQTAMATGTAFGNYTAKRSIKNTGKVTGWLFRKPESKTDNFGNRLRNRIQGRFQEWKNTGGYKKEIAERLIKFGKKSEKVYGKKGKPNKIDKGFFASVWGGVKSGTGLFRGRAEKKEKNEQKLNSLYTRKVALQGEYDLLKKSNKKKLTQEQHERLNVLPDKIIQINKEIRELEEEK